MYFHLVNTSSLILEAGEMVRGLSDLRGARLISNDLITVCHMLTTHRILSQNRLPFPISLKKEREQCCD